MDKTILIVEDEFIVADDLQLILQNAGYKKGEFPALNLHPFTNSVLASSVTSSPGISAGNFGPMPKSLRLMMPPI